MERKRTKAGENGTVRGWPPLVPTGRGGKRDAVARFVETLWKTRMAGKIDIQYE